MQLDYYTPPSPASRRAVAPARERILATPPERPSCGEMFGIFGLASGVALAVVVVLGLVLA